MSKSPEPPSAEQQ